MFELIVVPTITTASVMTALTVANFAGALFTVGNGVIAVAPVVIATATEIIAAAPAVLAII